MARKKKKKKTKDDSKSAGVGQMRFDYRPFSDLSVQEIDKASSGHSRDAAQPEPEPEEARHEEQADDLDAVHAMMDGVEPLKDATPLAQHEAVAKPILAETNDSELVMRHLDELVHGIASFDIADTDEYIEASVHGLDRRIVKKLRRGEYSYQAHLDLHGMRRDEARLEVGRFVEKALSEGKRCLLIVHGRGLRSKDHIPVLKEKLRAWLTRGAMGKKVLAYTSARPFDGGSGAVYVLLRG